MDAHDAASGLGDSSRPMGVVPRTPHVRQPHRPRLRAWERDACPAALSWQATHVVKRPSWRSRSYRPNHVAWSAWLLPESDSARDSSPREVLKRGVRRADCRLILKVAWR